MKKTTRVFVDSDVIISSLLSSSGAAFYLLNNVKEFIFCISTVSQKELEQVAEELDIPILKLHTLIKEKLYVIPISEVGDTIKKESGQYVFDENDAHIVKGAVRAKANFLISYNTKDFKAEKIKQDFGIILTTPANLLQYLRSL